MGKYDVDFDGFDPNKQTAGYDGEEPKKGTYDGILVQLNEHTAGNGNESIRWVFEITEEPYIGWRGYIYSNMDTALWRTQELTYAINGGVEKKTPLDVAPEGDWDAGAATKTVKKAKPVRLRVKRETYEGEPKAKISNVLPNEDAPAKKKKAKKGDDPF
jgi:hypothetical protein